MRHTRHLTYLFKPDINLCISHPNPPFQKRLAQYYSVEKQLLIIILT